MWPDTDTIVESPELKSWQIARYKAGPKTLTTVKVIWQRDESLVHILYNESEHDPLPPPHTPIYWPFVQDYPGEPEG